MAFSIQRRNCESDIHFQIDNVKRVGIIGSGQMGLGIAYVAANVTRLPVVLMDVNQAQNEKGLQFMGIVQIMFVVVFAVIHALNR